MASLPDHDPSLDPAVFDIFVPADQWSPRNVSIPKATDRSSAESRSPSSAAANQASNLYCGACKKKFNNEATWQNHLKSAKHLANAKGKSKQPQPQQRQTLQSGPKASGVDPQLADALKNLQRASANPHAAVPTLWSLSKMFYSLRRPQNTYQSLRLVVDTLQSSNPTGLTASQISSTVYISRLALARLLCLYPVPSLRDGIVDLVLDALNDKWKVDRTRLTSLAKTCTTLSVERVMQECRHLASRLIDREEARTEPPKPKSDQNQCFTKIFAEAANILRADTRIRIVLLCLASAVCRYEQIHAYEYMIALAQLYQGILAPHRSSEAHVICHHMSLEKNDVRHSWWHLFMALLLALETDDMVRADDILDTVERSRLGAATKYEDMQVLLNICVARKTYDYRSLQQTIPHQVAHIALLLELTDKDLLLRQETDEAKRNDLVDRMRSLALATK